MNPAPEANAGLSRRIGDGMVFVVLGRHQVLSDRRRLLSSGTGSIC